MSRMIRVLLADDSMVVRRMLSQALARHADLVIAGIARNGREALELLDAAQPDVVLLDVEMPELNGVDTAAAIRRRDATLPILMFSSLTVEGGKSTFEALSRGANDYVAKPKQMVSLAAALDVIDSELVTKIRFWGRKRVEGGPCDSSPPPGLAAARMARPIVSSRRSEPAEVVVIGVSTGGPDALALVLAALPRNFALPILIVQHMPPVFTGLLAARLDQVCPLLVREAAEGDLVTPGTVLIAPGNRHMSVACREGESRIVLDDGPLVNSCRPAVDVLFQSVAQIYGRGVLGAVLTGMGRDGTEGARAIKTRGGRVLAQNQETCVVWGMPRAVADAGLADQVLPLSGIAPELVKAASPCRSLLLQNP